ncbi:hypothetical protein BYT27DRAFT_7182414 [Phlegmacium glaucopus]|nr:hypothetical protein BYT27DRAFT_7182414 [Phlegmacium glaucopus]
MNPNHEQQIGTYVNSLTPATNLSLASGRNSHQNSSSQLPSAEEEMQRQLDELNRSVTIIIWYKANTDPIRLQQILPTFPYFQLSRFSTLIADLGLTSSSYLDTYIPLSRHWEQHTITSVRVVETQQRLLYKLRRSLIEGLSEDECVSFREEIQLQTSCDPRSHILASANGSASSSRTPNKPQALPITTTNQGMPAHSTLKRPAPQSEIQESGHSPKVHISHGYYLNHSGATVAASETSPGSGPSSSDASSNVADPQSNGQDNNLYMYQPVFYGQASTNTSPDATPLPQYLLTSSNAASPIPYHPHPPLKRWPNDYTVSEISNGFHAMDVLISHSSSSSNMTQRIAFERVFGSRYVKSTVCRHRAVWRKAHQTLREQFESMGADDRACWGEFVRRVEGRPPGKNAGPDIMSPTQTQNNTLHYQNPTNGEDVHGQDPVLNSMQVNSTPNNTSMQNSLTGYDGSRAHLSNGGQAG